MTEELRSAAVFAFGVTGHRDISLTDRDLLRDHFSRIFREYLDAMPSTSFVLLTALAEGADQIAAEVAFAMPRFEVVATLPMPLDDYLADFPDDDSRSLLDLLSRCTGRIDTSELHGSLRPEVSSERDSLYQLCGRWVSDNCQVLVAAWDGEEPTHVGGTADIVYYRVDGLEPLSSPHSIGGLSRSDTRFVLWCPVTRGRDPRADAGTATVQLLQRGGISEVWTGTSDETAWRIEEFNHASQSDSGTEGASLLLYEAADTLASRVQGRYRRLVQTVTGFGIVTLLCIDAMQTTNDLRLAVVLLGFAALTVGLLLVLRRTRLKTRFQQARYLAEGCRVQLVWLASGISNCPVDFQIDGVGSEGAWIRASMRTAWTLDTVRPRAPRDLSVARAWLEEQLRYFLGSKKQPGAISRMRRRNRVMRQSAWLLIIPAVLALGTEIVMMLTGISPESPLRQGVGLIWALGIGGGVGLFTYGELMGYGELSRRYALLVPRLQEAAAALAKATSVKESQAVIQEAGIVALRESGDWLVLHSQQHVRPFG